MQFKVSLVAVVAAMQLEGAAATFLWGWPWGAPSTPAQCPLAGDCSPRLAAWPPTQQWCQANVPNCVTITQSVNGPVQWVTQTVAGTTTTVTDTVTGPPKTITSTCTGPPTTITKTSNGPPVTVTKTVTYNPWQNVHRRDAMPEAMPEAAGISLNKRTFWFWPQPQPQCTDIGFADEWSGILSRNGGGTCCGCAFPTTTTTTVVTVPCTSTTYVTIPVTTTVCVTVPGPTNTITVNVPGPTKTSTKKVPGTTKTVTVTVTKH